MSNKTDSLKNIIIVTFGVCIFCAIFVSSVSIVLRPAQLANSALEQKRNIMAVLGAQMSDKASIEAAFAKLSVKVVDLEQGRFVDNVDPVMVNSKQQTKTEGQFVALNSATDIAGIKKLEKTSQDICVYIKTANKIDKIVLPIRGYGLWSTLYGYIALEQDFNTIAGISFYQHAETPGLGGEVDNPKWKAQWIGKKIYDVKDANVVRFALAKSGDKNDYQVDSLSGASLTSRGVQNLVQFWFSSNGFGKLLTNLKQTN